MATLGNGSGIVQLEIAALCYSFNCITATISRAVCRNQNEAELIYITKFSEWYCAAILGLSTILFELEPKQINIYERNGLRVPGLTRSHTTPVPHTSEHDLDPSA